MSFKNIQAWRIANINWERVPVAHKDCLKHSTLGFGTVRFPARALRVDIP